MLVFVDIQVAVNGSRTHAWESTAVNPLGFQLLLHEVSELRHKSWSSDKIDPYSLARMQGKESNLNLIHLLERMEVQPFHSHCWAFLFSELYCGIHNYLSVCSHFGKIEIMVLP